MFRRTINAPEAKPKKRIGELLLEAELITGEQLKEALEIQKAQGGKLVEIMIAQNYLDAQSFVKFLSRQQGIAGIDLMNYTIPRDVINLVSEDLARKHEIIPIDKMGKYLTVAMACPLDTKTLEFMQESTGLRVKPLLVSINDLQTAINRYYAPNKNTTIEMPQTAPNAARDARLGKDIAEKPASIPVTQQRHEADNHTNVAATSNAASSSNKSAETTGTQTDESMHSALQQIESALAFDGILGLARRVESLPALSQTVLAMQQAMKNPEITTVELALILNRDPALSAKVLALANSPAYGFSHHVASIELAATLIGTKEIFNIVLSAAVIDYFKESSTFDYSLFWKRSLFCASAAKHIAQNISFKETSTAFAAGLLHDLGRIVLAEIAPNRYSEINQYVGDQVVIKQEMELFGVAHPEVGYILADAWLLPEGICSPIRFHHTPFQTPNEGDIVRIVAMAAQMTDVYTAAQSKDNRRLLAVMAMEEPVFYDILGQTITDISNKSKIVH